MAENNHDYHVRGVDGAFLTINNTPVFFSEDWNAGIGGGLWSTGLAIARYLERHADEVAENLRRLSDLKYSSRGRDGGGDGGDDGGDDDENDDAVENENDDAYGRGISALELGSGHGFLSACLLALVASHHGIPLDELVVTDVDDHLDLVSRTLRANSHVWDRLNVLRAAVGGAARTSEEYRGGLLGTRRDMRRSSATRVLVAEHLWGEFDPADSYIMQSDKKYDFIFGSDVAYRNSLHGPLISSLVKFSHRHTLSLIGVTMTDTQPAFFELLTASGFRYEKLADHLLEREFRGGNFGIIAIQKR
ncbi:hypothetical protein ACHAXA_001113 [Cyclostephanos tholiformis]|uniref:Uncharacterized protein n=1 Tax=Cyclostephanos tholiformis TaxID=382380 RepID=A0ABD3RD60_9STRA